MDPRKALITRLELEVAQRKARNRLRAYQPYPKQLLFHALGRVHNERLLMAANQVGKSFCGAAEAAIHLTGRYPDWWEGRVFDHPPRAWAGSKTGEVTRDGPQRLLIGEPKNRDAWGTGFIPHDALHDWSLRAGVADALDSAIVRWGGGGDVQPDYATLGFKSYDQGREKWQAETLDFVWADEEPPMDVYQEAKTRTNATAGMIFVTFTPLLGVSDVVQMYANDCPEALA